METYFPKDQLSDSVFWPIKHCCALAF